MARIKMFSKVDNSVIRRKLFSDEGAQSTKVVICGDCGFKMETTASTTDLLCPKCGGTRFNVEREFYTPAVDPEPIPKDQKINDNKVEEETNREKCEKVSRVGIYSVLPGEEERFQKSFSETRDEFELNLKTYSGKEISSDKCKKIFGCPDGLVEKGFAEIDAETGNVKILDTAFIQSRLFSKITIQVTKTLELDPSIVGMPIEEKPKLIEGLEDKIGPKGVILIKKSHNFPIEKEESDWTKDSGIVNDIPLEFGGQKKPMPEFKEIIDERYPDAPDHILDILKNKGIIKLVDGDNIVEIQK